MVEKIIPIAIVLLITISVYYLIILGLKRSKKFNNEQLPEIKKALNFFMSIFVLAVIAIIIGIDFDNLWATILSVLAVIAIAFFAVWSLLSNIIAGVLIFARRPFKTRDWIEVHPESIRGKVKEIGMIFTTLEDDEKNLFKIPNNLLFQRYIKVFKKKPTE